MKIYGIRHHGPGCARSLLLALEAQQPDAILVEAPAEVDSLLADAANPEMKPPFAALLYQADSPQIAAFYPYARFSPEWQALQWAQENNCPVRSMDLPAAHSFALQAADKVAAELQREAELRVESSPEDAFAAEEAGAASAANTDSTADMRVDPTGDPLGYFARADGYADGERWWNDKLEERSDSASFFDAILEAVTALRAELANVESDRTLQREAWMRRQIRAAKKDGFTNIAVVCGAWHAPVLANVPKVSEDNALLKGLPKVKVSATWTPWTYERLAAESGYGAGVRSPGWYDHLWSCRRYPFTTWMTKAARVLRQADLEGSPASIIEATRLAESLAGMRGRPKPGLDESLEAIRTVFCAGEQAPLALLKKPLLIGKKMGTVPEGITNLPLQRDIEATQKRLRLKPVAEMRELVLDLREESGRNRSAFLHRLQALSIRYGRKTHSRTQGTFKESWRLEWQPGFVLDIVDASRYGNTLEFAAGQALLSEGGDASIETITERLDLALLADLPDIAPILVNQLNQSAASTSDAVELMRAVPALVRIVRYGDVRKTDSTALWHVLGQLTTRIHVALVPTSASLADDKASALVALLRRYAEALNTLQDNDMTQAFMRSLQAVANSEASSPEPKGCATRLLSDANELEKPAIATLFSYALSSGNEPADSAAWLEGFLSASGAILVHDTALLALVDDWLPTLTESGFVQILPLLRRTFGQFSRPERSQIGQVVQSKGLHASPVAGSVTAPSFDIDFEQALPALTTVTTLLNLPPPAHD
ncbi:DUF5682 family protein [Granulosicoccus antarcticus]|uniref:Uncharacterized protein n=1 Tax=Granulosicoccus antarcticus IMCC3135 TaxID=1192854 RepID=A0A2Z2P658_9GAMM|nr:DUF5682 family protein [Granulosicoccus antarcticus]ASJ76177.1 hypothetical protein IMCC3135_30640 [Granulosicoccus antarcticus IMCC3135]